MIVNIKIIPNLNLEQIDNRFLEMIDIINKSLKYKKLIKIIDNISEANVVLCNRYTSQIESFKIKYPSLKIIICERYDSCTVSTHTKNEHITKVDAVFKEYIFKNSENYNKKYIKNRYHFYLMDNTTKVEKTFYSKKDINKIKCVSWNLKQYSTICNKYMDRLKQTKILKADKTIDVFLVFHEHEKVDILYQHRQLMESILKKIEQKHNLKIKYGPILTRKEYDKALIQSKICISPYGLGSRIALDQFGVLAKTIVIKPPMGHIIANPDIYGTLCDNNNLFEYCDINYSNIENIILKILNNYEKYFTIAEKRKDKIIKYDNDYYIENFYKNIIKILT